MRINLRQWNEVGGVAAAAADGDDSLRGKRLRWTGRHLLFNILRHPYLRLKLDP